MKQTFLQQQNICLVTIPILATFLILLVSRTQTMFRRRGKSIGNAGGPAPGWSVKHQESSRGRPNRIAFATRFRHGICPPLSLSCTLQGWQFTRRGQIEKQFFNCLFNQPRMHTLVLNPLICIEPTNVDKILLRSMLVPGIKRAPSRAP